MVSQIKLSKNNGLFIKTLCLGFLLLPFIYYPPLYLPYEIPRVLFVLLWVELMIVIFLITRSQAKIKVSRQSKLSVFLLFVAFIGSFLGSNLQKSIIGNFYRLDGLITLIHLVVFSLIVSNLWQKKYKQALYKTFLIANTVLSFFVILSAIQLVIANHMQNGINIFFGQPNFLAGYILITIPFSAFLYKDNLKKLLIVIIPQSLAIISTHSRASIILLVIFLCLFFVYKSRDKYLKYLGLFFVFTSILVSAFYLKHSQSPLFVAEGRERIFKKGLLAFQQKPLLGWGWANFDHAFDNTVWPFKLNNDVYVDKAHSHFLEYLVTTGFIGFLAYILLISFTILTLKRNKEFGLLIVLMLYIIHSQTNVVSIAEDIIFWFIVGVSGNKT